MTAFPSLQADTRVYALPRKPATVLTHRTGWRGDFSHDRIGLNSAIEIEFQSRGTADRDAIISHYRGQKQHEGFQIPATIWQNHLDVFDMVPAWDFDGQILYKYDSPPSWEMAAGGLCTIRISIRSFF